MDDDELLRASRLWSRDAETGERGFTLAAALLVGSDDLIFDVAPAYRTEALLRRIDLDRYDDRGRFRPTSLMHMISWWRLARSGFPIRLRSMACSA